MTSRQMTTALLCGLVLLGIVLRVHALAEPYLFTFDEELFARNAHRYLIRLQDLNDHPPAGKFFIALGLILFGYGSLGWRFASLWFGIYTIAIGYWLGSALFRDRRAGFFVGAFMAADGFFIAYSRAGLMDGVLTCFVLATMLAAVVARRPRGVAVAAVLCGIAMSVKWSGAFAVFPAVAAVWTLGRVPKWWVLLFGLVPLVHLAIWTAALAWTGQPADPASLFKVMHDLFWHHVELGKHHNGLASPWYSWIVLYHPIVTKLSSHGLGARYSSSVGNLAFAVASALLVLGVPIAALGLAVFSRFSKKPRNVAPRAEWTPYLLGAFGWFAMLSPWTVGRGEFTFHYHYLPSYAFAVVLLGGAAARLERVRANAVFGFVLASAVIALYFAPVWGEYTLSEAAANRRLVFKNWQP
ncbi:MAG TPA: phospholipid carrier-dependent glycosyltransferase [Polyangiaceae bacterium]|jgi:dolichyl-phosphate-mannose--protein O-mannosyl transferase|nr:phospholipid carrier-dependent glycosyltransferase [Polyangiaceae bacterium]